MPPSANGVLTSPSSFRAAAIWLAMLPFVPPTALPPPLGVLAPLDPPLPGSAALLLVPLELLATDDVGDTALDGGFEPLSSPPLLLLRDQPPPTDGDTDGVLDSDLARRPSSPRASDPLLDDALETLRELLRASSLFLADAMLRARATGDNEAETLSGLSRPLRRADAELGVRNRLWALGARIRL